MLMSLASQLREGKTYKFEWHTTLECSLQKLIEECVHVGGGEGLNLHSSPPLPSSSFRRNQVLFHPPSPSPILLPNIICLFFVESHVQQFSTVRVGYRARSSFLVRAKMSAAQSAWPRRVSDLPSVACCPVYSSTHTHIHYYR